ncbi:uncharacterized protein LOC106661240 isoform X2 [Cimex lectularius]|nr:uncharacterized protein LOC106661240 isoform X2 [Cimex lectularius]XP_014240003.1 uncharacterized protein LOC106661240 isoform X2 [Cimex lectularius]XP_014240004.1 uncharacterized protein LOC106661240 isoform X2 [Cimex lectularius]
MRGKLLARRQSLENKKRTSTPSFKTLTHVEVSPRKSMVAGLSKQADQDTRIKPPIDSSNLKHKIIKLNSTNRRKSDDLEKVVIKDKSKECSSQKERSAPCQEETNEDRDEFNGKKHKKIKIDFSDKSEKSTPTPKVVDSKRLSSSTEVVPKKKHKRIVI